MKIQKTTIKALIIKDGKALFVLDRKGKWELPGGRIEFGESPIEALRREMKEELGIIDFKIGGIIDVFSIQQTHDDGNEYQFIVIVYKCFSNMDNIKLSQEHTSLAWLGENDTENHPMKEGYKNIFRIINKDTALRKMT